MSDTISLVREEIGRLADAFEAADRRGKSAATIADREAAEDERQNAAGEFWSAGEQLADLLLLLLRYAIRHRPDVLHDLLADALRSEILPLAEAVARLEARR